MCFATFSSTKQTRRHIKGQKCDKICKEISKDSGHVHHLIVEEFESFDSGLDHIYTEMYDSTHVIRQSIRKNTRNKGKFSIESQMIKMECKMIMEHSVI